MRRMGVLVRALVNAVQLLHRGRRHQARGGLGSLGDGGLLGHRRNVEDVIVQRTGSLHGLVFVLADGNHKLLFGGKVHLVRVDLARLGRRCILFGGQNVQDKFADRNGCFCHFLTPLHNWSGYQTGLQGHSAPPTNR